MRSLRTALVVVALAAACAPSRPPVELGTPPPPAEAAVPESPARSTIETGKAAPRWVRVASVSGIGDRRTDAFEIAAGVLQWRVTATCQSGHVRVAVDGEVLVDRHCPGRFFGFSIRTGSHALDVQAGAAWEAIVEQQVDDPIAEPPLPGMSDRNRLARGSLHDVEQHGKGAVVLFRLPDGRRALRLDPFFVTANDDLFVWVSEDPAPRTSAAAVASPHVQLEPLKATAGAQNYLIPEALPTDRIRSIVIWCEPVRTAYAAAPLHR